MHIAQMCIPFSLRLVGRRIADAGGTAPLPGPKRQPGEGALVEVEDLMAASWARRSPPRGFQFDSPSPDRLRGREIRFKLG